MFSRSIIAGVSFSIGVFYLASQAYAAPVVTIGAGTAVTTVDRSATFDTLSIGTDLSSYTEDGLSITAPATGYYFYNAFGDGPLGPEATFGPFFYASGGVDASFTITTVDSKKIDGLELNIGTGFDGAEVGTPIPVAYVFLNGGVVAASGTINAIAGDILGFSDTSGFDTLLLGAYDDTDDATVALADNLASDYQAAAIDNVKVELAGPQGATGLPAPGALTLLGFGVAGLAIVRRSKLNQANISQLLPV